MTERELIDTHHALGVLEVDGAQRVAYQQPCRVFFVGVHRVLEIENHAVG